MNIVKTKLMIILTVIVSMFAGCAEHRIPASTNTSITDNDISSEDKKEENTIDKNPFDLEKIKKSGVNIDASYGWGIRNYDGNIRNISLGEEDGTDIVIDINASSDCEVGYLLFIDGLPQKYTIEGKEGYNIPVFCSSGETEAVLNIEPIITEDDEEHVLFFACMYNPSFRTSADRPMYGNYHRITHLFPWKISGDFKKSDSEIKNYDDYRNLSEELKEKYMYVKRDGTVRKQYEYAVVTEFCQNGTEGEMFKGTENTQMIVFGGPEQTYRISVFVDNEPAAVFDNAYYMDVTLDSEKMAVLDLDLSGTDFSDYSCLYAFICPIGIQGIESDPFVVVSDSITLFK